LRGVGVERRKPHLIQHGSSPTTHEYFSQLPDLELTH
jgi:hypothetical protein